MSAAAAWRLATPGSPAAAGGVAGGTNNIAIISDKRKKNIIA